MQTSEERAAAKVLGKCDAPRCGSPATIGDRFGGCFCKGHAYLAAQHSSLCPTNATGHTGRCTCGDYPRV